MTALQEFDRLESGGLWRDSADAQRRDVTVSFGNATLVISDSAGRALTHWSLPAIIRKNPGTRPALFAPDTDDSETLEIEDPLMIDAIEKVRKTLLRARPARGRLRHLSTAVVIAAIVAAGVFWAPNALTRQTLAVVPLFKRSEIGATVLGHYQRLTGPTCRGAEGTQALARLKSRLLGAEAPGQIVVVQELQQGAVALPGGITLLDRALVEQYDDVAIPAGYVIAAQTGRARQDPLAAVLQHAGLRVTMTLLTTGDLPTEALRDYAQAIHDGEKEETSAADLTTAFDAAQLPTTPYALSRLDDDAGAQALADADPMQGRDVPTILPDRDWVRLQGICTN